MKLVKFFTIIFLMFSVVFGIANSSVVTEYVTTLKVEKVDAISEWNNLVEQYAKEKNEPPIEPKVDKIWKLIPGYNGLEVDIEATLKQIKQGEPKEEKDIAYVFREVEPKRKLSDLGSFPIYRGNPKKPTVSFMINVAWGTEYLEPILNTLRNEGVKATFFLDGSWIKKNPEMAKRIASEGHEIGNHAYSHPQMSKLTNDRIKEEIIKTEKLIKETINTSSSFFAPPSGDYDSRTVKIARELGLYTVLWTLDTIDWQKPSPETIYNRIVPKIGNGYLVLMHPTQSTKDALPKMIREIKKKGFKITTVKETLSTKRVLPVESISNF